MLNNHLKIAWRLAWKVKSFTFLNIVGLSLGFAGFMLASAYINRENNYDRWNPNFENIYLVGIEVDGKASDMTPASLSPAIKAQLPEVEESGRANRAPFEVAFLGDDVYFIKDWVGADRSLARIFGVEAAGFSLQKSKLPRSILVTSAVAQTLFPNERKAQFEPKRVVLSSEDSGIYEFIHGTTKARRSSVFTFECIGIKDDIAADGDFGNSHVYQTFIQVKSGTDAQQLTKKINSIYHNSISKEKDISHSGIAKGIIYLDPLKNLHLHPRHGSSIGYKIVVALGVLSSVILLLAAINFANLMIVQAQKRAKEIGIKKVLGINRKQLYAQFLSEVFVQCICAFLVAACLVVLGWKVLSHYFNYEFTSLRFETSMLLPLATALLLTVFICGLYPATILSGYNAIAIVKGNYRGLRKTLFQQKSVLIFQFVIVFVFLSIMLVINRQMVFIKESDRGFSADQVVYIKNLAFFNKPGVFAELRNKMREIPGIMFATVATNVPGGIPPKNQEFRYAGRPYSLGHIAVDYEYFETLDIRLIKGRLFSSRFPDTLTSAILNESATKSLGLKTRIGSVISGCGEDFKIIGVVKDSKMQGFEYPVQPIIYTIKNPCNVPKVEIMAKISALKTGPVLLNLKKKWATINKHDGQHFIYEFVDEKYAALHLGQQQLEQTFTAFTILIILVALLGLCSISAFAIRQREKEIAIRKVVGAGSSQILLLLNRPFLRIAIIAILFAAPIAYGGSYLWLETFAYRVDLSWWIFAASGVLLLLLAFVTVTFQALRAAVANPIKSLRTE
jgi:putative ABC transport system permease protein